MSLTLSLSVFCVFYPKNPVSESEKLKKLKKLKLEKTGVYVFSRAGGVDCHEFIQFVQFILFIKFIQFTIPPDRGNFLKKMKKQKKTGFRRWKTEKLQFLYFTPSQAKR